MKKKFFIAVLIILLILILIFLGLFIVDTKRMEEGKPVVFSTWGRNYSINRVDGGNNTSGSQQTDEIQFALTMDNKIDKDIVWCGTFQLIWNDLKNDLAKQDIVFNKYPDMEVVKNLNKGTFSTKDISENSYYKIYGHPTNELKNQIENAIKEKFNETSDILDDFEWDDSNSSDYMLYCMLKKEFKFPVAFKTLEKGKFANKYDDIEYFGLEKNSEEQIRGQVEILYYKNDDEFVVKLKTEQNDEVILAKGIDGNTFNEIYNNIVENEKKYDGDRTFTASDELKVPKLDFDEKRRLKEVENKAFSFSDGTTYKIGTALQTIEFELDEEGGKIKSEAGMSAEMTAMLPEEVKERKFYLDDKFIIFLKETDKDVPYFSAIINDITKFE